jgi:heptosyltransferase-2
VATPETADVFERDACVDEVIRFDKRGNVKSSFGALCAEIRKRDFSCALLPHRSFRSASLAYRAGVGTRIGFHNAPGAFLYTHRAAYHYSIPEAQRNLSLLSAFGAAGALKNAWFSGTELKDIRERDVRVVLAPGSQWETKMWGAERYAELARHCVQEGWRVCLCGSGRDMALCDGIAAQIRSPLVENYCGKTGVQEFMEIVRRAAAVVSNDSAPVHVANEVGTPVVAMFGPTAPEFGFAPRGAYDQIVQVEGLLCRPCAVHGGEQCPVRTHACMKEISSDMVIEALRHVVNLQLENAHRVT